MANSRDIAATTPAARAAVPRHPACTAATTPVRDIGYQHRHAIGRTHDDCDLKIAEYERVGGGRPSGTRFARRRDDDLAAVNLRRWRAPAGRRWTVPTACHSAFDDH